MNGSFHDLRAARPWGIEQRLSTASAHAWPLWVGCDHSLHRRGPLRAYSVEKPGSAIAFLLAQDLRRLRLSFLNRR
ncbi:hypothetical protein LZ190_19960, partial [Rhodovulum sulfidophilum]|nr:hypothetical protein [Rhodovulum sulfidophilum]